MKFKVWQAAGLFDKVQGVVNCHNVRLPVGAGGGWGSIWRQLPSHLSILAPFAGLMMGKDGEGQGSVSRISGGSQGRL
eukprot:468974-Pelagomonas_calceolata.AAC.1